MLLPHDDLIHTGSNVRHKSTLPFNPLVQFTDINYFSHIKYSFNVLFIVYLIILFFSSAQKYGNKIIKPTNIY